MLQKKLRNSYAKLNNRGEDCFNTSLSDLMAGLLSIFILLCLISSYGLANLKEEYSENIDRNHNMRVRILTDIQTELAKLDTSIKIEIDENGVIQIPGDILFDNLSAELKPIARNEYVPHLTKAIVNVLQNNSEYRENIEALFIEGHTDSKPIIANAKYKSNWELSTQRAINTYRCMLQSDNRIKSFYNRKNEPLISCSGYADLRPRIKEDATDARNRRVSFRFTMIPYEEEKDHK